MATRGDGVRALAFTVFGSIAVLMGCATSHENPAQLVSADNEKCISYGTTPGTPAYTDCRLKVEHQRALLAAKTSRDLPAPHIPELSNCSQRPNLHQPNGRTLISLSDVMAVVMGELRKPI